MKKTIDSLKQVIRESEDSDMIEFDIPEFAEDEIAQDIEDFISDEDILISFGSRLLAFGVRAHFWHLNCNTDAAHLALKDLYEACDSTGDKLLESVMSQMTGIINSANISQDMFNSLGFDSSSITEIIQLRNDAEDLMAIANEGIKNILADFVETCDTVIYKLNRLS